MEDNVFADCECLRRVTFREGSRFQKICELCFTKSALEEFVAPAGLKKICGGAFYSCKRLRRAVLNEGLEALADQRGGHIDTYYGVFQGSRIEEVTLPSTLREIGRNTFKWCSDLKTIYVEKGCQVDCSKLGKPSSVRIVG